MISSLVVSAIILMIIWHFRLDIVVFIAFVFAVMIKLLKSFIFWTIAVWSSVAISVYAISEVGIPT